MKAKERILLVDDHTLFREGLKSLLSESSLFESGRIDSTRMTTHRFPFDRLDEAFAMMSKKADNVIKPLILF